MTQFDQTYYRNYRMMLALFGLWMAAYAVVNFVLLPLGITVAYGTEAIAKLHAGDISFLSPMFLRLMQLVHAGGTFLVPVFLLAAIYKERPRQIIGSVSRPPSTLLLLGFSATILSLPFIYMALQVNQNLPLPNTAVELEKVAVAQQTKLLGEAGWVAIVSNIFVFAIMAPLCEEFFFRGALQRILYRLTSHQHLPVILTAFGFSAIHMQFEGFIPRLILGMMFGYLALWSGNIWVSTFCHFVYNGGQLLLFYLYQHQVIAVEPDQQMNIPFYLSLFSAITTALVLKQFYTRTIIKQDIPE